MSGAEYIPSQQKIAQEKESFYVPAITEGKTLTKLIVIVMTQLLVYCDSGIVQWLESYGVSG